MAALSMYFAFLSVWLCLCAQGEESMKKVIEGQRGHFMVKLGFDSLICQSFAIGWHIVEEFLRWHITDLRSLQLII